MLLAVAYNTARRMSESMRNEQHRQNCRFCESSMESPQHDDNACPRIGSLRHQVNGISEKNLSSVRTMIRMATSTCVKGGSSSLDMMLEKKRYIDPGCRTSAAPLIEWTRRINVGEYAANNEKVMSHARVWAATAVSMGTSEQDMSTDLDAWKVA